MCVLGGGGRAGLSWNGKPDRRGARVLERGGV